MEIHILKGINHKQRRMNKRKVRDIIQIIRAIVFSWLYIPHFIILLFIKREKLSYLKQDLHRHSGQVRLKLPWIVLLLFFLHNNRYFRTLFYYRTGPIFELLFGWYRPGVPYLIFPKETQIAGGVLMAHPFGSVLNARKIGSNFSFAHNVTLAKKNGKLPVIGDNVQLAPGTIIIGDIKIGNNVVVGAGSVVTKDIPDNSIVAGNPAKIIRQLKKGERIYLHGSEERICY